MRSPKLTRPPRRPCLPAYLDEVRHGSLILLYRLLFVLYAEDRNLLPDKTGPYAPYCLTRIRLDIAERQSAGARLRASVATYLARLASIFRLSPSDTTISASRHTTAAFSIPQARRSSAARSSPTT